MKRGIAGIVRQIIQGQPGSKGAPGAAGTAGKSAYDIAVTQGYAGTETQWLASLKSTATSVTIATATSKTPLILLGANADITLTLSRSMPNNAYTVDVIPPAALLGNTTITVKNKTATTVTLNVVAGVAVSAGQGVTVIAAG